MSDDDGDSNNSDAPNEYDENDGFCVNDVDKIDLADDDQPHATDVSPSNIISGTRKRKQVSTFTPDVEEMVDDYSDNDSSENESSTIVDDDSDEEYQDDEKDLDESSDDYSDTETDTDPEDTVSDSRLSSSILILPVSPRVSDVVNDPK
jgi:hypothetical protein